MRVSRLNNQKLNYWERATQIFNFSNDYKLFSKVIVPV